jgi:uncharacterized protein YdaU (DUF1376 family)
MAKDPAFPFYAQDYLVDTLRWSRSMKSLHVDLLAESWANGEIVDDNGAPAGLNAADRETWLKIVHKWNLVDGVWVSLKLEEVRTARKIFKKNQSDRGKKSAEKRNQKPTSVQPETNQRSTVVEPVESEEENEIAIDDLNKKEPQVFEYSITPDLSLLIEEKLQELDELYRDQQRHKWPDLDFDFEYRTFCEKVRGSPAFYKDHREGGIRMAFQLQLREETKKRRHHGITKTTPNKNIGHIGNLAEGFARRHGGKPGTSG